MNALIYVYLAVGRGLREAFSRLAVNTSMVASGVLPHATLAHPCAACATVGICRTWMYKCRDCMDAMERPCK